MYSYFSGAQAPARPTLSPIVLNLVAATYLLALCNATFWSHFADVFSAQPSSGAIFAGDIWALMVLSVVFLAVRWAQKPVLIAFLLIASVTSYYADTLGVIVDRDMIQNAATTTFNESRHLMTPRFFLHVALYGGLPSLFVLWVRVRRTTVVRGAIGWVLANGAAAGVFAGLLYSDFKDLSAAVRSHKELMASVQPLAPMTEAIRYVRLLAKSAEVELQPTGTDAQPGTYLAAAPKPVLMVIVAGETSRAQNWSLGGYARETNPQLARRDIVYFPEVTSCGTATAKSLPCMFSPLTRADFSYDGVLAHENLLDVVKHAGFDVLWLDDNTGHKDIANRVVNRMMTAEDDPASCPVECMDSVFLPDLRRMADTITTNTVLVLHTIGSHGPSYWLRYPPEEAAYQPACQSPEFSACSQAEIVNAYDNTIRYTDHFLSQVIDTLDGADRVIPAMFYVSDHGESLGEDGLYLHGAPYFMAPDFQTRVPMVLWTPDRFAQTMGLDKGCLADQSKQDLSHDNMFSTLLGLLDVTTEARDASLDFVSTCRKSAGL